MTKESSVDVVVVGAGHNGLVAACYLAMAGLSVVVLEKNAHLGGATLSQQIFPGVDARVSVYSYLISLLPGKILADLKIPLEVRRRSIASYSPIIKDGKPRGLLLSNVSEETTRQSFVDVFGDDHEYRRFRAFESQLSVFAQKIWPTLLEPLRSKEDLQNRFQTPEECRVWDYLIERPLSALIEEYLSSDIVRGAVFTDAKIGVLTHPDDPTLLQNRTFLYHVIGQGTGEWGVPVGGMGALVDALEARARAAGARFLHSAEVVRIDPALPRSTVYFTHQGHEQAIDARYVLINASSNIANRCLPGVYQEAQVDGSVFKINMVLQRLPEMKYPRISARDAFTGTFHINEGYELMKRSYLSARRDELADDLPGEMYCHSLTDPSILSPELQKNGYQTLTLFGLDVPYNLFARDPEGMRELVLNRYLESINRLIDGDIRDYLALDAHGNPCIEARSPVDLENSISLPKGNIFHGNLSWPFAERDEEVGTWGVETNYENVFMCGSSARRGGAVSGIPGHNAAMKVLRSV